MDDTHAVVESPELGLISEARGCQSDECTLKADLFLRSSDGIVYAAHSKNLELYSGGFPPSIFAVGGANEGELVQMTETSSVLALLLQYVHNQRQPDSSKFKFETLAGLAEAAEKYMVYSAIEVCKIRMQLSIPEHPLAVLAYAIKHGYPELRDAAAPGTFSASLKNAETTLRDMPEALIAWVHFRDGYIRAMHFLFKRPPPLLHRGGLETCELWAKFQCAILEYFEQGLDRLERIREFQAYVESELYRLEECTHCVKRARFWGKAVADRVDSLPAFSSFLG
ncbi:hypothetical protein K438DRAFT_1703790 [Mycena galopus ATCC 62051]|nr:hypothetical protein K438DRAFT_1703790 [Mycena galopus ATCC 62051]